MKYLIFIFLFIQLIFVNAQELKATLIKEYVLEADKFIGVDNYENSYYVHNNTLFKKTINFTYSYSNTQLGSITSIDITNPLKLLVFYRDFNTVLLLDNKLNELTKPINFTTESFSKNIAFASISSNNNLWLYSLDDNKLQLWNHQTRKIEFTSQPLTFFVNNFEPINQLSTYKNCWLIGKNNILKFNEYGSFIEGHEKTKTNNLRLFRDRYIFLEDNKLFYENTSNTSQEINLNPEVFIESFYVNTNHIYIFDGTKIFVFKIIKI